MTLLRRELVCSRSAAKCSKDVWPADVQLADVQLADVMRCQDMPIFLPCAAAPPLSATKMLIALSC